MSDQFESKTRSLYSIMSDLNNEVNLNKFKNCHALCDTFVKKIYLGHHNVDGSYLMKKCMFKCLDKTGFFRH